MKFHFKERRVDLVRRRRWHRKMVAVTEDVTAASKCVFQIAPKKVSVELLCSDLLFYTCCNWLKICLYIACVSKNAPTLASCSFDKLELILITFGRQHLHTFTNDTYVQLSLSLHFYLLYLLLNSCDGNDAFWRSSMLVKQSSSFSRKHRTLSLRICVRQTVRLTTELSLHICVR